MIQLLEFARQLKNHVSLVFFVLRLKKEVFGEDVAGLIQILKVIYKRKKIEMKVISINILES